MSVRIINADVLDGLAQLADESVHCVVTSPPYWGLRDYGVDGQIGLEATPAEFVARLVGVFREVRRVLRKDGTCWVNLGDSYASNGERSNNNGSGATGLKRDGRSEESRLRSAAMTKTLGMGLPSLAHGLKPKDLVGIPWRFALAMQEPYYAGKIKREIDRVWLAAMVDGEGCFYIHRRPAGQHAGGGYHRTQDNYQAAFEVANTSEAIIKRCMEITGVGSVIRQDKSRRQPLYRWTVRSNEARAIAREIYPYLVAKQQQARIIVGISASGKDAEAGWEAMKLLHAGTETHVDFPVPASMHEPGWYLRQDIIWKKPNPMPESVTDRCTKSHEYIFLLTKSERYAYDADAIKEPAMQPVGVPAIVAQAKQAALGRNLETSTLGSNQGDTHRNKRSVWTIATAPFSEAHFATFPPELPELCIKAGCPVGGTVLDPFSGAGTTCLVADRLQRNGIGIELNQQYAAMADSRISRDRGGLLDLMESKQHDHNLKLSAVIPVNAAETQPETANT